MKFIGFLGKNQLFAKNIF